MSGTSIEVLDIPDQVKVSHDIESDHRYWIFPVSSMHFASVKDTITNYVMKGEWGFTEKLLKKRKDLPNVGDQVCFYSTDVQGIVAHAKVKSNPETRKSNIIDTNQFPVVFKIGRLELGSQLLDDRREFGIFIELFPMFFHKDREVLVAGCDSALLVNDLGIPPFVCVKTAREQ